jgi:Zn-dependent alcohol dehydrogenase
MKAAVCYEFGQPLVVEEITMDPPQQGEVRVRTVATAICHSDIHLLRGEWGGTLPVVAGHESAGIVEEVGPDVTLVEPGDHVVVSLLRSCGRCYYCLTGSPHTCEGDFPLASGAQSRLRNSRGEKLRHGIACAAFADFMIVDQSQVVKVPDDLPLDRAALLACGVITGLGAVTNTAQVPPRSSVVVIGTGGVGLNAIQGAALSGAYPVIAIDMLENKLEAACLFGATHTLNARQENVAEAVREWTWGRGADYVFVTVGSTAAIAQGLTLLRREGTLVLVGIPEATATVALPAAHTVWNRWRILGSSMGSTRLQVDVPRLVQLYQAGRLKLDELITARYPLERINEAMAAVEAGQALRNVITFG